MVGWSPSYVVQFERFLKIFVKFFGQGRCIALKSILFFFQFSQFSLIVLCTKLSLDSLKENFIFNLKHAFRCIWFNNFEYLCDVSPLSDFNHLEFGFFDGRCTTCRTFWWQSSKSTKTLSCDAELCVTTAYYYCLTLRQHNTRYSINMHNIYAWS